MQSSPCEFEKISRGQLNDACGVEESLAIVHDLFQRLHEIAYSLEVVGLNAQLMPTLVCRANSVEINEL
jgi:hypothetical protein